MAEEGWISWALRKLFGAKCRECGQSVNEAGQQLCSECAAVRKKASIVDGMQSLTLSSATCALEDCNEPCFVDKQGKVHKCCGYSHALEHQRRMTLLSMNCSDHVKGITHCLLPECDKPTWPFKNYCNITHAHIGMQRNLQKLKSGSHCSNPKCFRLKYSKNGVTHDYCSKSCALASQNRNIKPYLKSIEEIHEFIRKFPELSNVEIRENRHAKPGGKLFKIFQKAKSDLQPIHQDTCLAFHGTDESNVPKIFENGYDPSRRGCNVGQIHGAGEYFAVEPSLSLEYCQGNGLILNELLLGEEGKDYTKTENIIVMKKPEHDLPRLQIVLK